VNCGKIWHKLRTLVELEVDNGNVTHQCGLRKVQRKIQSGTKTDFSRVPKALMPDLSRESQLPANHDLSGHLLAYFGL
jgi:hypothetical protein